MSTYYTEDHEWIEVSGSTATIGITDHAQSQLGDIVFVELPEVGTELEKGDEAAVVESVKAASEVYAPIDGEVTAVNEGLEDDRRPWSTAKLRAMHGSSRSKSPTRASLMI